MPALLRIITEGDFRDYVAGRLLERERREVEMVAREDPEAERILRRIEQESTDSTERRQQ